VADGGHDALVQDSIELVVQVNGKLRGHIRVAASASKEVIEAAALGDEAALRIRERAEAEEGRRGAGALVNIVV
jgi:leucyl-tRNA synthetase